MGAAAFTAACARAISSDGDCQWSIVVRELGVRYSRKVRLTTVVIDERQHDRRNVDREDVISVPYAILPSESTYSCYYMIIRRKKLTRR